MSTLAHRQSMFVAALEGHCPKVVRALVAVHESHPEDEQAALVGWCRAYNLLDLGEPCPWLLEVGRATLRMWREVPSAVGHLDLPNGPEGWSTQERPSVPELSWSNSAPAFTKKAQIEAMRARLAEIERELPRPERFTDTHFRWLALAKVHGMTRAKIAASDGTVSAEAIKQALSALESELQLRDAPGRPRRENG